MLLAHFQCVLEAGTFLVLSRAHVEEFPNEDAIVGFDVPVELCVLIGKPKS